MEAEALRFGGVLKTAKARIQCRSGQIVGNPHFMQRGFSLRRAESVREPMPHIRTRRLTR
jgi:hypothetical protein